MKTIIHVNQHNIKKNTKNGTFLPVLTVKDYKRNRYGHVAIVRLADGTEIGRFVYPKKPLSCGARVWFETNLEVDVIEEEIK